jgi:hypothetical protein
MIFADKIDNFVDKFDDFCRLNRWFKDDEHQKYPMHRIVDIGMADQNHLGSTQ